MKTKLFLSLVLIVSVVLTACFLPTLIASAQASTAESIAAVSVSDTPAAVERISITNQPLALGLVGLMCVLFGALTVMPLLNLDKRGGSAADEFGIYFDKH